MNSKSNDVSATDGMKNVVPPNTLAWAARVLDRAQQEEESLWRILPEVLIKPQPRLAPSGAHYCASVNSDFTTPSKESKS